MANNRRSESRGSDVDLVHAVRAGDKRAFVDIVARHQSMVCAITFGIIGDCATSEDAAQDAFFTAWQKFADLRDPQRLRGWLAQIARNAALKHVRSDRAHGELNEALDLPDNAPTPDHVAATMEEAKLVRQALANMPETFRLPLALYYREGQSVRAVAETLEISEDAVKQRLARGREMLRERMAGVVETVLRGSGPTPAFTMGVAAAIGALSMPTAAASTFTTSATACSATAAVPLPVLATKSILITAIAVASACVPIGYQIDKSRNHRAPLALPSGATAAAMAAASVTPARPEFETTALFAEWRALHQKHGTNSQAMPALYNAIAEISDPFRRRALRTALIAEWSEVDPAAGLAFFSSKGREDEQRRQFALEWLARDGSAALAAIVGGRYTGWSDIIRECLPEIARRMPSRLAQVTSELPKADWFYDTHVQDAFAILAHNGLGPARTSAESVTGECREQALAGVARTWALSDLTATIAWARALPGNVDRDEVIRAALIGKAEVDPIAALDCISMVPAGGRHAHSQSTTGARVIAVAAKAHFEATVEWLAEHPGLGSLDLMGLSREITHRLNADPISFLNEYATRPTFPAMMPAIESAMMNNAKGHRALVWEWLKEQPENAAINQFRESMVRRIGYQDPAMALRVADELPRNAYGDSLVESLASALFNGGGMLYRFESLVREAPERLRQPLIETAFKYLRPEGHGTQRDIDEWLPRLALLPESSRGPAIESIARSWAAQMPEEAIAWAATLVEDSRPAAYASIARTWAKQDPAAAASWIGGMDAGSGRDRCSASFAIAIAEQHPHDAWEWALTINDPNERALAASHVAKAVAPRDPSTAKHWLEIGPFTAAQRAELRAVLNPRTGTVQ